MAKKVVNILGCGVMGQQIASLCVLMGFDVVLWVRGDPSRKADVLRQQLRRDRKVLNPMITAEGSFVFRTNLQELEAHLTIETLVEELVVKREVIARLPFDVGQIQLITNTSSYEPMEIDDRAIGVHFFNPVCLLRCVEVCATDGQIMADGATFLEALRRFRFELVRTASRRGYIGNYLLFQEITHALQLVEQFQYPTQMIDTIQRYTGRTTSLFDIIDLIGVDTTRRILANLHEHYPGIPLSPLLDIAVSQGVYGKKNKTSIRSVLDRTVAGGVFVRL